MLNLKSVFCLVSIVVLSGCARNQATNIPDDFWSNGNVQQVGIAFVKPPTMYAHRSGSQGLLDLAINEAVTDTVESHINTISHDKFENSKSRIVQHIESRGSTAIVLPTYYEATDEFLLPEEERKEGYFHYDVSSLKDEYTVDHLLVIRTLAAGTIRDYYGFFPLSDPRGYLFAHVMMVDMKDNKVVMNQLIQEQVPVAEDVEWDDPENNFPEITKAVNTALEQAGDSLINIL